MLTRFLFDEASPQLWVPTGDHRSWVARRPRRPRRRAGGTVNATQFPVDDETLDLLDLALNPPPGSDRTSLCDLLDLLSGYDPSRLVPMVDADGQPVPDCLEYPGFIWSPYDVIRSLIAEVRRLRGTR